MRSLYTLIALAALVFAGVTLTAVTASATVLCEYQAEYEHGCLEDHVYKKGAEFKSKLKSPLILKAGTTVECTGSELTSAIENEGGESKNVGIKFSAASFSGCTCPTEAQSLPWEGGSIAWTSGTDDGTLSLSSLRVKVTCAGLSCVYGSLSGAKLQGGAEAVLSMEATLTKFSGGFLCPATATAQDSYYQSPLKPPPATSGQVFVESNPRSIVLCSANPCGKSAYPLPQEIQAKLEGTTKAQFSFTYNKTALTPECATSEIKVPFATPASPLVGTSKALTFGSCASGAFSITPETQNYRFELLVKPNPILKMRATETSSSPIIRISNGAFTCEFQSIEPFFSFSGGNPAKLAAGQSWDLINGKAEPKCESGLILGANYEITSPKPLFAF